MIRKKLFIAFALGMTVAFAGCSNADTSKGTTAASTTASSSEEKTEASTGEDSQKTAEATTQAPDFDKQYNYADYIELGTYKGIEYEQQDTKVTDQEVEEEIQVTLDAATEIKEDKAKKEVKDGDIANIDYTGRTDGKEFDGGAAEGYDLEIGSGSFIDGFEEQLVGMKVGEKKTIKVTFPKDYASEDLAGKEAEFDVKVNYIGKQVTPKLTDEYAKENLEADSVADYKKKVRQELEQSKKDAAEATIQGTVWNGAVENAKEKKELPEDMVKYAKEQLETQYSGYAEAYGMEVADFIEQMTGGMTLEECAKDSVKREMVAKLLIEKEKLTVSDSEYKEQLKALATEYQYPSPEEFEKANGKDMIEEYILNQKLLDHLVTLSKQVKATTAASTEATTAAKK